MNNISHLPRQQIELTKESIKTRKSYEALLGNPTKLDGLRFKIQTQS
jgi:hypothetical protein